MGVAVGVLGVVAIACWLIRRRRKTAHKSQTNPLVQTGYADTPTIDGGAKPAEVETAHSPSPLSHRPYSEMSGANPVASELSPVASRPHEMQATHRGAELPG